MKSLHALRAAQSFDTRDSSQVGDAIDEVGLLNVTTTIGRKSVLSARSDLVKRKRGIGSCKRSRVWAQKTRGNKSQWGKCLAASSIKAE